MSSVPTGRLALLGERLKRGIGVESSAVVILAESVRSKRVCYGRNPHLDALSEWTPRLRGQNDKNLPPLRQTNLMQHFFPHALRDVVGRFEAVDDEDVGRKIMFNFFKNLLI